MSCLHDRLSRWHDACNYACPTVTAAVVIVCGLYAKFDPLYAAVPSADPRWRVHVCKLMAKGSPFQSDI